MVQISISWCTQFESAKTDIIESLIVNAESVVCIFNQLVNWQLKTKEPKVTQGSLYIIFFFILFLDSNYIPTPIYGDLNYLFSIAMSVITTCLVDTIQEILIA